MLMYILVHSPQFMRQIYMIFFAFANMGCKTNRKEYKVKKLILISNDPYPRQVEKITVLPWRMFLDRFWVGEILK